MSSSPNGGDRDAALAELFHSAVRDAPPASFDEHDVLARYRYERMRRARVLTGAVGVVAVLVVAGVLTPLLLLGGSGSSSSGNLAGAPRVPSMSPQQLSPHAQELPGGPSKQGDGPHGRAGPRAGGTRTGCARVDRELATALAGELPVSGPGAASPLRGGCVAGGRGASLPVYGQPLSVVLLPGTSDGARFLAGRDVLSSQVRHATSGGTLVLYLAPATEDSGPSATPHPRLLARLPAIARKLAATF